MLLYQIKNAVRSLRRNPILSGLLIGGIALGVAVSTAFITTYYVLAGDPIPHKSDKIFHVELDSWSAAKAYNDDKPELPPDQITYRDMQGLMQSDIPTYQGGSFQSRVTIQPGADVERPFRADVRLCFGDFFRMFDAPFEFGGPWDSSADAEMEAVVVIDAALNHRLFGGDNSVGRTVRMENRDYTVVGVLDRWRPDIKFYDLTDPYGAPEQVYLPFNHAQPLELNSWGNISNWKFYQGDTYANLLQSEAVWIQMWVQLNSAAQRRDYVDFLDAYVLDQKTLGRFERPLNNRLVTVSEWMTEAEVVPNQAKAMLVISLLFLVVCSVNLIGILLGKFLARAPEAGVRRALGASQGSIFMQHLVECEVVGITGGVLGVGLSTLALALIDRLFDDMVFRLDLNMILAGLSLSLIAGLIAGIYPSWRICRVAPATYLKIQ